jgi:hypothetical protein
MAANMRNDLGKDQCIFTRGLDKLAFRAEENGAMNRFIHLVQDTVFSYLNSTKWEISAATWARMIPKGSLM